MERTSQELELYSIPNHSSWFSWNNIHETERSALKEFFDASSITRSPRIYKEYRDFIISKFRQNPSKKLTFTDVRKSLVGDVSILRKVFTFLEKWGLINFNADSGNADEEEKLKGRVKVEEGAPYGVRVVAAPNSTKPIAAVPPPLPVTVDGGRSVGIVGEDGFRWPPLASYSDLYGEYVEMEKKGLVCGSCKENCDWAFYEYLKEGDFILCEKCFASGNYDKNKYIDDFKLKSNVNEGATWTEAETLLLLESVSKHGHDWDLVSQYVQTKTKADCISKLMQLPFGDLMLGPVQKKNKKVDTVGDINDSNQMGLPSGEAQDSSKPESQRNEPEDNDQPNGGNESASPPKKKARSGPTADIGSSLMEQVAGISAMLGPHIMSSAGEAAIKALCKENQCSREMFDDYDSHDDLDASPEVSDQNRAAGSGSAVKDMSQKSELHGTSLEKNLIAQNLRTKAATATALGAAAANAKLLADQEERKMGQLVAIIIDAQLKKMQRKMKYFDDLEMIMEKEQVQLEDLEESLVAERLKAVERAISTGINKPKEHTAVKYPTDAAQQK